MTEKGTFIINGTERVIVNQLQRSPGIIFEHDGGKTHTSRKVLYSCRVIPMRGSWLDFDFDHKDILYVRIDRRRKMPATILFKAMGMSKTQILDTFYKKEEYRLDGERLLWKIQKDMYRKEPAFADIPGPGGDILIRAGKTITRRDWRILCESGLEYMEVDPQSVIGLFLAQDVVDSKTGEIMAEACRLKSRCICWRKCARQGHRPEHSAHQGSGNVVIHPRYAGAGQDHHHGEGAGGNLSPSAAQFSAHARNRGHFLR